MKTKTLKYYMLKHGIDEDFLENNVLYYVNTIYEAYERRELQGVRKGIDACLRCIWADVDAILNAYKEFEKAQRSDPEHEEDPLDRCLKKSGITPATLKNETLMLIDKMISGFAADEVIEPAELSIVEHTINSIIWCWLESGGDTETNV